MMTAEQFNHATESAILSPVQAQSFIDDPTNDEAAKETIRAMYDRYKAAKAKHPDRNYIMSINRMGNTSLWWD